MTKTYVYSQKVHFPDIDLGGGMYHAKYLDYYDEARQALLIEHGLNFGALVTSGFALVLVEANLKYLRPAGVEDTLHIYTTFKGMTSRSVTVEQIMTNKKLSDEEIASGASESPHKLNVATITLVSVDLKLKKSVAHPDFLRAIFEAK